MYINFKLLKQKLDVASVIKYLGIKTLTLLNNSYVGRCPIHNGDNSNAFHFNVDKKIYNCFTHCGGGNILDFIAKFKQVNIMTAGEIGLDILKCNNIYIEDLIQTSPGAPACKTGAAGRSAPVGVAIAIDRGAQDIQSVSQQNYLKNRNITCDTAKYFGLGYCKDGYFRNRITIPIHSDTGKLLCNAYRSVDNSTPKYLFKKGFKKNDCLFNFHRIINSNMPIFIVEGFFSVFKLFQFGLSSIAIMGSSIDVNQLNLLKSLNKFYYLLLDGDVVGRDATFKISKLFTSYDINFKPIFIPTGTQPDVLNYDYFQSL